MPLRFDRITIRRSTKDDERAVLEAYRVRGAEALPGWSPAEARAAIEAKRLFVAVRAGEVLGLLDAVSERLTRVVVRPEWAARGLGRWLVLVALGMGVQGAADAARPGEARPMHEAASR